MGKSLSEMRASAATKPSEWTHDFCLASGLAEEYEAASRAFLEADQAVTRARAAARAEASGDAPSGPPRRAGEKSPLQQAEAEAQRLAEAADEVRARVEEHVLSVRFRKHTTGDWQLWCDKHPPRDPEVDPTGGRRDAQWSGGVCNIDDLWHDLGLWAVSYGGEEPRPDSWEFVRSNAARSELAMAASVVVQHQEQGVEPGKSRVAWLSEARSATG